MAYSKTRLDELFTTGFFDRPNPTTSTKKEPTASLNKKDVEYLASLVFLSILDLILPVLHWHVTSYRYANLKSPERLLKSD